MTIKTPYRPVLRWHGGKWRLALWIIAHLPAHRIYTEAYGGAGSVLMRKPRVYSEIYNDLNADVVNLFRVLQCPEKSEQLLNLLRLTPFARHEYNLAQTDTEDEVEKARYLIIRCFMGFGSNGSNRKVVTGFRASSSRSGTTPAHDWKNYPDALEALIERIAGIVIESRPAAQVLLAHDKPETVHYVDPPYVPETRGKGATVPSRGYTHEMTADDHQTLATCLHGLKGMVVLSGYPSDLYDQDLFPAWHRIEREAHADGARERTEVLWLNDAAATALATKDPQRELFTGTAR